MPSATVDLSTAPCIPSNVVASYDCDTSITTVLWDISRGADSYVVYVEDIYGNRVNCTNTYTICYFPTLPCGQNFSVTVIALLGGCTSMPSQPVTVSTGPCPHSNLHVSLDCSTNSALVSWTVGDGILFYTASADNYDVSDHVTCGTAGSMCNITYLQCAQHYQITVSGQGATCPSPAQGWLTVNTGPCPPTQVSVHASCGSDIASVSWAKSQGSLSYMVTAQSSEGYKASCGSNGTTCDISGLRCGQTYKIYVSGVDKSCTGPKSDVQLLKTAPCMPQNVQMVLGCQSTILNVTWQQTGEATNYQAMVQSSDGHITIYNTNKSSLAVPSIVCGLTYSVEVIAQNEICNSSLSSVQHAVSAPCPPRNFSLALDCASNTVSVNWYSSVPGVLYMAQAISTAGYFTCNSTSTGCNIIVPCGMSYNITVTPILNGCAGAHSPYKTLQSAPCPATLTHVEMDCLFDSAWVTWNASVGAESYITVAIDNNGHQFECRSNNSMCAVSNLECGRNYSFGVIASNRQCNSTISNTKQNETAPCPPIGVAASVGCLNGTVNVWWNQSVGALSYRAILEHSDGNISCCSTHNSSSCAVTSLPCGQMYALTVIAEGRFCNSSQSMAVIIQTAPCKPQGLTSSVNCSTNVATMTWANIAGGLVYTVYAVSEDKVYSHSCESFEGSCDLSSLVCGLQYTAILVAQDSTCISEPSEPTHFKTVPCIPQNVSVEVECHARGLTVFWEESRGSTYYTATLMDSWGHSTNCMSFHKSCNISGLACGNVYHASVLASDAYCSSPPSNVVDTYPVTCAPSNIQAVMDCQTQSALLSWKPSAGALLYTAVAISKTGYAISCQNNETNCELLPLVCGSTYSISVEAQGHSCRVSASMSGYLETGPCVVEHVSVVYSPPIGQILWDITRGAVGYVATAVTQQGLQMSCSSLGTSCILDAMACSQSYNITLTSINSVCPAGVTSAPVTVDTEPCPPNNVKVRLVCSHMEGVVTWEASVGAVGYVARLDGRQGDTLSCQTTDTSCSVSGLQCGTAYVTTVMAIGASFSSSLSIPVLLTTAPCPLAPGSIAVAVGCDNDTASVSWALSVGATSYELTAASNDGYVATCASQKNNCTFTNLMCGQTYNLSLTVVSSMCQITQASNITFQTRPCVPLHVAVNLVCGSATAVMSWLQNPNVLYYQASATLTTGGAASLCNSTTDTCQFKQLQCGAEYSFTVRAHSHQCHSDLSNTVYITTEPCKPQHLTVSSSCENNTILLDWDNAAGALGYTIVATGNLGYTNAFQTNVSILEVNVPCGQSYSFTVEGQDNLCNSPQSTAVQFTTAPCAPFNLETFVQCEDSVGSISWAGSDGAESYTVVARDQHGQTKMYSTNATVFTWSDLVCGEVYTVRVIANNLRCSSAPSNSTVIHMAPCIPQGLMSKMDCNLKVGSLTWNSSQSAESYLVTAEAGSGHRVEMTTNSTHAQIPELHCGQQYYLTVIAIGQGCRSSPSNTSALQTEPCPPTAVFTKMDCISNIAEISWSLSNTADHYTAKAVGPNGQSETCMSLSTSCGMATLQCGEMYNVTVTASNRLCASAPSQLTYLNTGPCIPVGVSVKMNCIRNEANVSWSASQGATFYQVFAQSKTNDVLSCNSTGSNMQCIVGNLTCGMTYTVQVVAVGIQCSSLPSQPSELRTVPCSPDVKSMHLNCSTNSLLLDWRSSGSYVSYTAVAQATGGQISSCSTNFTSCEITQLICGQTYNVTVIAIDGQCDGKQSATLQVSSVPCRPVSVLPSMNCSSSSAHIQWSASSGADSYEVQAIGTSGHVTGCNTTRNVCDVPNLQCGDVYNITVFVISKQCVVTNGAIAQLHTEPCVPVPHAGLNCASGAVTVSWQPSGGATFYTAVAQSYVGFASTCNSSSTSCVFSNLLCGRTYSFTVSASDSVCSSAYSHSIALNTVPCVPNMVSTHMDCQKSTGLVSWEPEEGGVSYLVEAIAVRGQPIQCHSTNTSCSLPNLLCGQTYNLTVTAQDSHCSSSTTSVNLQSVPCVPTSVQASLLCSSNSAAVSWQTTNGALGYLTRGLSADGLHTVYCNSSLPYCNLEQLHCGTSYNVTVVALDNACQSGISASTQVQTAPCPPQNVSVHMNCSAGTMTVTWAANLDAVSFHVDAVTSGGANLSCDTSGTSCSISGLPCGFSYSVTVRSIKGGCKSGPSSAVQTSSAPCIPQGATGSLDCVTNSVWVQWQQTMGAESYVVMAVASNGTTSSCSSSALFCSVSNLLCGVQYTFHINALNSQCSSPQSNTFQIQSAPCALMDITAETVCNSNSIVVHWQSDSTSSFYVATAEGQDLSILQCNSTGTSCVLMGARCGMQYTIIVSSSSNKCSSLRSPPFYLSTAPCTPVGVTVKPLCELKGMLVSWAPSALVQSYTLKAAGQDGDIRTCSGPAENCSLTQLHCGQAYTISLVGSAANCTSPSSQPVTFQTAPCGPQGLAVSMHCETNSATLTWTSIQGSVWYYGMALSSQGTVFYCNTTGTTCSIGGLQCGTIYNFTVKASDGICNSSLDQQMQLGAAPCPPAPVTIRTRGVENSSLVRVYWSPVTCQSVEYLVELNGSIHDDPFALVQVSSYWTQRTYFEFFLPCDVSYLVTVRARNQAGFSVPSAAATGPKVPCPVTALNHTDITGRRRRDLREAEMIAELMETDMLLVPEVKVVQLTGMTLHVEWAPVLGASYYTLILKEGSHPHSFSNKLTIYGEIKDITDLEPNTHYCVFLSAKNSITQSAYSSPVCVTTGASF
ncbi:fibronectin-like [Hoplias malabaricus]|uniref:fibronectin-like n=1 Tax=Hoplias malabaricus TaxID=27720 RepID=UPI0034629021